MPDDSIYTEVDGQRLKLTNTSKIIYPELEISKAEIIQYYLQVAEVMIPHIKNRLLTLIRFPDGVEAKQFYSKNMPSWAPDWVKHTYFLEDKENKYVYLNDQATLIWIANLAGLEIHPMNTRVPNLGFPDQFIYDLDPSEEFGFEELKELAIDLKEFLEGYGYNVFLKTSGGKGLHIYLPLKPIYDQETVNDAFDKLTKEFSRLYPERTTMSISKEKRKGKVLLDIYRNRKAQSCVAPYSLRGRVGAPVSMPIDWEELPMVGSGGHWNIRTALEKMHNDGDRWADIWRKATTLHTQRTAQVNLKEYNDKRDFKSTAEPEDSEVIVTSGRDFVIQMHDASNLHFDLRLEIDGTLWSWAVPKGMPSTIGEKRLAIRTEDHPLKYLDFSGEIPEGEYGGGTMWIYDRGVYEVLKMSDKKIQFKLKGKAFTGTYKIYNTKNDQWLLEMDRGDVFNNQSYMKPMLASASAVVPSGEYFYEIKWDGIRATIIIENETLKIYSRSGNDITAQFPLLQVALNHVEATTAVMDGEIVYLDADGKPDFSRIVGRIHYNDEDSISHAAQKTPAVLYLFDLLYLDGRDTRSEDNVTRREWLRAILTTGDKVRFSEAFEDGNALFSAIEQQGMEGIMAKKKKGIYRSGARSSDWLKIKVRTEETAYVIGYTQGEGDRSQTIGALHLALQVGDKWKYMGKVGTGFTMDKLKQIQEKLEALKTIKKPVKAKIENPRRTVWVEPIYRVDLEYASLSSNGTYREPVFKKMYK